MRLFEFGLLSKRLLWASAFLTMAANIGMVSAGQSKVSLCHLDEYGDYNLLSIPQPATVAHIGHGDSFPGDIVPGSGGRFSFSDDCTFLPACPCLVDLPVDWEPLYGASSIALIPCDGGGFVNASGAWWTDGVDQLNYGFSEQCDGPTLYSCSAGGITREISQAQYSACQSLPSFPD